LTDDERKLITEWLDEPLKRVEFRAFAYDTMDLHKQFNEDLKEMEKALDDEHEAISKLLMEMVIVIKKQQEDTKNLRLELDQTKCFLKQFAEKMGLGPKENDEVKE
jgi:hypothetical protein